MKRDMELMRIILFKIEDIFTAGQLKISLTVEGYDKEVVADHCELLYEAGLIKYYDASRGGIESKIISFSIGNLTNRGYDYLELIRNDETWNKTKQEIEGKNLPKTIEWFAKVAGVFSGNLIKELNG